VAGSKLTTKGIVTIEYLEKFKGASYRQIARKLLQDYPTIFPTFENARDCVNKHGGAAGEVSRKKQPNMQHLITTAKDRRTRFTIPKSKASKRVYHHLPAEVRDVIWMSDIHFPNHDEEALTIACEYAEKVKPQAIIIGGDLMDNTPFTRFRKPPSAKDARGMFDMTYNWLKTLREMHPKAIIWWIEGNHDRWYKDWLIDHCEQVFDDPYYQLEARLKLDELKIKYIPEKDVVMCGKLPMLHGHTIIKGVFAPVNSARGGWLKIKHTVMFGHTHQVSRHAEKDLKGKSFVLWSAGCLCTLHPDYDPHNTRHSHGLAHVIKEKDGKFMVHNYEIIEGELR